MNLRYLLTLAALPATLLLTAQSFRPLGGYDQLDDPTPKATVAEKMACDTFLPGDFEVITVGEDDRRLRIDLDTAGLGSDLDDVQCFGCDTANFGTVALNGDTLSYRADLEVEQGFDTLRFVVCTADGESCSDTLDVVILVQRAGRTISLGSRSGAPLESFSFEVPEDDLPGGAICRDLVSCGDYPGRDQRFFFNRGFRANNDFTYRAGRFGGMDQVCVRVCNEFGLCDTYRASITIERDPITLPFFDDFAYAGDRPDLGRWQDADVLINRSFGDRPPSIGVATFDAIGSDGQPYVQLSTRGPEQKDYLTSAPILMAGEENTILSFWLQPRGLGNRPERQDSFQVQFLTEDGVWRTVFNQEGLRTSESNASERPFILYEVPVAEVYRYDGFQFRFANLSAERGGVDNWNLDYVKLIGYDDPATAEPRTTGDLALTRPPFYLTAPYTAVPLDQLRAGIDEFFKDSVSVGFFNHLARPIEIVPNDLIIRQTAEGGGNFQLNRGLLLTDFFGANNGIDGFERQVRTDRIGDAADFPQVITFLESQGRGVEEVRMEVTYGVGSSQEDSQLPVSENNQASTTTVLSDYYAYDDGTAEVTLEGDDGLTIVQRYTLFTETELGGIAVRIPRGLRELGDQDLNLVVYTGDTLPREEVYRMSVPVLFPEELFRDSLQGFTTYRIDPADGLVSLSAGNFFIGWEQSRGEVPIGIGFDRNRQVDDILYFNNGQDWQSFGGTTSGVLMIRPIMGLLDTETGNDNLIILEDLVKVFPNPTADVVQLRVGDAYRIGDLIYRLFATDGRQLAGGSLPTTLGLGIYPRGVYFLEVRDRTRPGRLSRHQLIRR